MRRRSRGWKCAAAVVVASCSLGFVVLPAAANVPSLSSMLLTVNAMPTGWSVDNTSNSGASLGCISRLTPVGIKKTATANVTFASNASVPTFSEGLSTYAIPASRVFAKGVAELDTCKTLTGTSQGHKITGTIGALSFPRYGDQSAAWALSFTVEGATVGEDVLVVRKGPVLALFAEADLGSPDLVQFQGFVRKALARVR